MNHFHLNLLTKACKVSINFCRSTMGNKTSTTNNNKSQQDQPLNKTSNKPPSEKPKSEKRQSKKHDILNHSARHKILIDGYMRTEYQANKHTNQLQIFPSSLIELIFKFYHIKAILIPFDTETTAKDHLSNFQFELTFNNCKVRKKISGFAWILSELDEGGLNEGIHVFRFKIHNPEKKDLMWGISPYKKQVQYTSYDDDSVIGWYITGTLYKLNGKTSRGTYDFYMKNTDYL